MRKTVPALLCCLTLAGCGYRAPLHKSYIPVVTDSTLYAGVRPDYRQLAALMEKDTGMEPVEGNTVTLVTEGQENLNRLLDDVKAAEISVYIEPYRFCLDSVGTVLAGILREKAAAGTDVRIILDKSANTQEDIRKLKTLRNNGAQVNTFHRPAFFLDHWIPRLATHRNHRKLLILDGRTAYIGSRNIQDKYFFDWHDTDVRITGPVVADLTEAFHGNQRNIGIHRKKPLYVAPDLEETARRDTMPGLEQFFDVPVQVVPEYPTDRWPRPRSISGITTLIPRRRKPPSTPCRKRPGAEWTSAGSRLPSRTSNRKEESRNPCMKGCWKPASASMNGRTT